MDKITIKRGDTFSFKVILKDESGSPLNINISEVQSQVRTKNTELVQDLLISPLGVGEFKIYSNDTSMYPATNLEIDVRVRQSGESFATNTILLEVEKAVTVWK